jgi:multidrug efflux pump subunit AcrB
VTGFNLSAIAVRERSLTLFLLIATGLAGTVAFLQIGRAENPEIAVKAMVVSATWPGATVEEMQSQVADPLEKRIQELRYYDRVETVIRPGSVQMMIQFIDTMPIAKLQDEFYQVRKKLGDEAIRLPPGVQGPIFNDDFADAYFALYSVESRGLPHRELVREAEQLRQQLLAVEGVNRVDIIGEQAQRIYIEFSYRRLAALGVTPAMLASSIARRNDLSPSGFVDTSGPRIYLRPQGAIDELETIAESPIEVGGHSLKIRDIAQVRRGYEDPPQFRVFNDGEPSILLGVNMQSGYNGLKLDENLAAAEAEVAQQLPLGIGFVKIADQAIHIANAVNEFSVKFVVALFAVMCATLLTLGPRVGMVVAAAVPLTLGITFVAMLLTGRNIDQISLGALILSLGLLVDDAIIAIEIMVVRMEQGIDRIKAAAAAWSTTAAPMLSGTLVTVIGFIPIGLAPSGVSEFAGDLFWVVAFALLASWFVAVVFTPYLGVLLLPGSSSTASSHEQLYQTPRYQRLRAGIERCIGRRRWMVTGVVASLLLSLAAIGLLKLQFFPSSDRPELLVEISLPQGSAIGATQAIAHKVAATLQQEPEARHVTAYVGQGAPRFFLSMHPELPDPAFAKVVVLTDGTSQREAIFARASALVAAGEFPEARIRVTRLSMGPPVPYPVSIRVHGPDIDELRRLAFQISQMMATEPTIRNIKVEAAERAPSLQLRFDLERLSQIGLDPQSVSEQLDTLLQGRTVTHFRDDLRSVDVVVRAIESERRAIGDLGNAMIVTASGASVPLSQVARLVPIMEEPVITRRDREIYIAVQADPVAGSPAPEATTRLMQRLAPMIATLPAGYRIEAGGDIEESSRATGAIVAILPVMVLLMMAVIMIQVRSFSAMFLVLATAPLGFIGGIPALLMTGRPFGFTALLGLIALAGILMRNTLILVDQIRRNREAGMNIHDAVIEATVQRARPVILTALAAALAFMPLTLSTFWGELAIVLIGGLVAGTALTIFFLPALYALWYGTEP